MPAPTMIQGDVLQAGLQRLRFLRPSPGPPSGSGTERAIRSSPGPAPSGRRPRPHHRLAAPACTTNWNCSSTRACRRDGARSIKRFSRRQYSGYSTGGSSRRASGPTSCSSDGDPLRDISAVRNIAGVWCDNVTVSNAPSQMERDWSDLMSTACWTYPLKVTSEARANQR